MKQAPPAERALSRELNSYRTRAGKLLIAGLVLLGVGIGMAFFYTPGGTPPHNNPWLYRTYGERGMLWGGRGFGVLMMLLAAWLFYIAVRRLTVGVRTLEANSRQVLGLTSTKSAPPPSKVGFLVVLLVGVVAVAALYLLNR